MTLLLTHDLSPNGYFVRWRGPRHLEVWGDDISEHYLLCYDEQQPHLLDVFYIPFETVAERGYAVG